MKYWSTFISVSLSSLLVIHPVVAAENEGQSNAALLKFSKTGYPEDRLSAQADKEGPYAKVAAWSTTYYGTKTVAIRPDGTLVTWRGNVPSDLEGVVDIEIGYNHVIALLDTGEIRAWDWDLGVPRSPASIVPDGLAGVIAISAGYIHSLALLADGTVQAWGDAGEGRLNVPEGLSNVVAIAAATNHSLALTAEGRVVGWGSKWGPGRQNRVDDIVARHGPVKKIFAGGYHSAVLFEDGRAAMFGKYYDLEVPVWINQPEGRTILDVSCAFNSTAAILDDGTIQLIYEHLNNRYEDPEDGSIYYDYTIQRKILTFDDLLGIPVSFARNGRHVVILNGEPSKASQTIDFPPLGSVRYGRRLRHYAVSSSGQTVHFHSSNKKVVLYSGGKLNVMGAGSVTITARAYGNGNYLNATPVSQSVEVKKARQEITFRKLPKVEVGGEAKRLRARAGSGLPVRFSSNNEGVARIVRDDHVRATGRGKAKIKATQRGDKNWLRAKPVVRRLRVK